MKASTVDLPPLSIRAEVGSVDPEARTVELIFSTGAGVDRMDYWTGKRYREVLSLKPQHVRLDRLNAGGPLLDAHSAWSVADVLGTVQPGTARIDKGKAVAVVRFSKREAVEPIFQDVRDGIIRNVSVGYRVHKFEEDAGTENKIPVRTAVDWEPFEISMVPMPADAGAQVRSGDKSNTNPCVIIARGVQEPTMEERTQSETIIERDPLDPGAPTPQRAAAVQTEPNERDAGVEAERVRCQGIINGCRSARLPQSIADKLISEGISLEAAQTRILDELGRRGGDNIATRNAARAEVIMGDDPLVHVRANIENAILHRISPSGFKLTEGGRQYRGLTLLDTARVFLQAAGVRTTGFGKMELAGAALGLTVRAGMHTTSDFANLLADVANKTLRAAYEEAPATYKAIGRQAFLPDFKPAKRLQLGEAPQLKKVLENGEFTRGTIGEGKEQYQLATYGRVFAISRQALINDDTDAFGRVTMLFGRSARDLESDLVWEQITANGNMGDGVALFHATHNNLAGAGAVISVATLGAGRAAMRKQKGLDGKQKINVVPVSILVPPDIETTADQFVTQNMLASAPGSVNPFAGKLQVVAEPRLGDNSVTAWYLGASPSQIDIVEYAMLEGESGPVVESRIGFDIDGVEIKCRHDFAAKVLDYRGLYKNPGA